MKNYLQTNSISFNVFTSKLSHREGACTLVTAYTFPIRRVNLLSFLKAVKNETIGYSIDLLHLIY